MKIQLDLDVAKFGDQTVLHSGHAIFVVCIQTSLKMYAVLNYHHYRKKEQIIFQFQTIMVDLYKHATVM